jgi:hypothetical protein
MKLIAMTLAGDAVSTVPQVLAFDAVVAYAAAEASRWRLTSTAR